MHMLLAPTNQHSVQYHTHHHIMSIKEMFSSTSTRSDESSTIWSYINSYCWWFRNPANPLEVGSWFIPLFTRFYTSKRWFFLGFPCRSPLPLSSDLAGSLRQTLGSSRLFGLGPSFPHHLHCWYSTTHHAGAFQRLVHIQSIQHRMMKTEGYESLHRMYEARYVSNLFSYDVIYIQMFKKMKQSYFLSARTMHAHVCVPWLDDTVYMYIL